MPCNDCSRQETCPPCVEDDDWTAADEAEALGLTSRETAWLESARLCIERLNESLERNNSPHRWSVLGDSDPRRRKQQT